MSRTVGHPSEVVNGKRIQMSNRMRSVCGDRRYSRGRASVGAHVRGPPCGYDWGRHINLVSNLTLARYPPRVLRWKHLMWSAELCRLPQLDGISLRVMQTSEAPVGIRLRVNLNLNS